MALQLRAGSLPARGSALGCRSVRLSRRGPATSSRPIHHPSPSPYRECGPARGGVACSSSEEDPKETASNATLLLTVGALVFAGAATLSLPMIADPLQDFIFEADALNPNGFGPADTVAAVLWGISLYYASPWQQLLLFLGKIETERPSDWMILLLARGPLGLSITDVNQAPGWLSGVAAAVCLASGFAISGVLQAALDDSIWGLSTGLGSLMAAGVYELGRPARLDREAAAKLDEQWLAFVRWANGRLVRGGRCHESEVVAAFRREVVAARSAEALPDATIKQLIRNWHPNCGRTSNGYYKNLSLTARVDAFTGTVTGGSPVLERLASGPKAAGPGGPTASQEDGGAKPSDGLGGEAGSGPGAQVAEPVVVGTSARQSA